MKNIHTLALFLIIILSFKDLIHSQTPHHSCVLQYYQPFWNGGTVGMIRPAVNISDYTCHSTAIQGPTNMIWNYQVSFEGKYKPNNRFRIVAYRMPISIYNGYKDAPTGLQNSPFWEEIFSSSLIYADDNDSYSSSGTVSFQVEPGYVYMPESRYQYKGKLGIVWSLPIIRKTIPFMFTQKEEPVEVQDIDLLALAGQNSSGELMYRPFLFETFYSPGSSLFNTTSAHKVLGTGFNGNYFTGDFNGDSNSDLAEIVGGKLWVYQLENKKYNQSNKVHFNDFTGYSQVFVNDWNGNSQNDDELVLLHASGDLKYYDLLIPPNSDVTSFGAPSGISHIFSGDFTGDGKTDLLQRANDGKMYLFPFDGSSLNFPSVVINMIGFNHSYIVDWNGDGTSDLLVSADKTHWVLYEFVNGQVSNTSYIASGSKWKNYTHYFFHDWNKDGSTDLVCRNDLGELWYFKNGFYNTGSEVGKKVGEGFNYDKYFIIQF